MFGNLNFSPFQSISSERTGGSPENCGETDTDCDDLVIETSLTDCGRKRGREERTSDGEQDENSKRAREDENDEEMVHGILLPTKL